MSAVSNHENNIAATFSTKVAILDKLSFALKEQLDLQKVIKEQEELIAVLDKLDLMETIEILDTKIEMLSKRVEIIELAKEAFTTGEII